MKIQKINTSFIMIFLLLNQAVYLSVATSDDYRIELSDSAINLVLESVVNSRSTLSDLIFKYSPLDKARMMEFLPTYETIKRYVPLSEFSEVDPSLRMDILHLDPRNKIQV